MTNWTNQPAPGFYPPRSFPAPPPGYAAPPGYPAPAQFSSPQFSPAYPPPSGQSYGQPYGQPYGGPPRKKSGLGLIILTLVAVAVVVLGGLVLLDVINGIINPETPPIKTTQPDQTKPQPPKAPPPTAGGDYQVPAPNRNPPLPQLPETYEDARRIMTSGKIFAATVPQGIDCRGTELPLRTLTKGSQTALDNITACLMKTWHGPIEQTGYQLYRPSVTIYSGEITTKCGKAEGKNAFFCSGDQQVYIATDLPAFVGKLVPANDHLVEAIMAHEFGHLLQYRTGLFTSAHAFAQKAQSKSDANEWVRRLEGNADCSAGQYVRAVAASQGINNEVSLKQIAGMFYALGDDNLTGEADIDADHGLGKTRASWFVQGLNGPNYNVCNSFVVPPEKVR